MVNINIFMKSVNVNKTKLNNSKTLVVCIIRNCASLSFFVELIKKKQFTFIIL